MRLTNTRLFAYLFAVSLGIASVHGFTYCRGYRHELTAYTFAKTVQPYNPYYLNNDRCYWKITAFSSLTVVRLSFTYFSLESSSSCSNDYLSVYDGSYSTSPIIGKYCGKTIPPMIVSKGRYLYLSFRSSLLTNSYGFTMSYQAIYPSRSTTKCSFSNTFANNNDIKLTSSSGYKYIYSPSYPSYYPTNMQCTWKIQAPSGTRIKLYFEKMSIAWSSYCTNDYLRIRDGYYSSSSLKGDYCGTTRRTIYSSGRYLWLRFRSNYVTGASGFRIRYTTEGTSSSSSSTGVIVGVILGIAVIVGAIVAIIYCTKKKRAGVVHSTAAPSAVTTTTITTAQPAQRHNVPLQPMGQAPPPYENPHAQKVAPGPGYGGPPPMGGPGYGGPPPMGGPGYGGAPPTGGPGYGGPPPMGGPGHGGPPPTGGPGYGGPPPMGGPGYGGPPPMGGPGYNGPPPMGGPPPVGGPGYAGPPPQGYQGPPPGGNYPGQPLVGGPPPPGPPPVV